MPVAETLWRVFPFDPAAREGEPFSAGFLPPAMTQGSGRFDLPDSGVAVMYLAESPEHAVAELMQGFRGAVLETEDLTRYGKRLALVSVVIARPRRAAIFDLCSAPNLAAEAISPDNTAARTRATTQAIAGQLYSAGYAGLRWWSTFFGEWHTVVLFRNRLRRSDLTFGTATALDLDNAHVIEAANALGIALT
ncbi:MAG: RES family NAD+ phosphorylase [Gemmatimonadota bacterium]